MNDEPMAHEDELWDLTEAARIHAMTLATPNLRLEDVHDFTEDGPRLHPVEPAAILERITRTRDYPSERERETEGRTRPWNVTIHATLNRTATLRDGCTEAEDFRLFAIGDGSDGAEEFYLVPTAELVALVDHDADRTAPVFRITFDRERCQSWQRYRIPTAEHRG